MNVSLTPVLESLVKAKVESGLYNNASEVVREALRLMEQRDQHTLLRKEIERGVAQLHEGKTTVFDMNASKAKAIKNAKTARKVNPLVTPDNP